MAHVHGAKAVADAGAKMMDAAMGKMGETMAHPIMTGVVAGAVATTKKSTLKKILTHPITLIGLGFALGYTAYKYRHQIIEMQQHEE
ncbi:hypothetical protein [Methylomonas rapida]|jgi:hypothetical protein|uniref:Uncharacterized protein n=1 Tax=Methylomonas rapida TaxID=2963939 RepID=A0ABY7GMB0_9GAMM|nr:hypothetical protein [Methylomonas rapida]WAR45633.1 hypothetical protein NM686_003720 [Methylomonas rapida]